VVLDLGLPDPDALEVLRALRAWTSVPVLVVSGRTGVSTRVAALDAGADDFVTKPFALVAPAARLRALLRPPARREPSERIAVGAYTVDLGAYRVLRAEAGGGQAEAGVHLTPTEWRLPAVLLRNPERLVTGRELLTEVWGREYVKRTNHLRIYMAGLRRKLEADRAAPSDHRAGPRLPLPAVTAVAVAAVGAPGGTIPRGPGACGRGRARPRAAPRG
jgi:two-component system, OmpR family, KDP operon response regulator KdpE